MSLFSPFHFSELARKIIDGKGRSYSGGKPRIARSRKQGKKLCATSDAVGSDGVPQADGCRSVWNHL